ncbi:threonine synthase [Bacillus sp. JCM 19046]|nr:threonine synthase [Bacillus sp. JCM 19045]GAF18600.1 threonine synthase [Bacillus sp. JCM 19046]
MHIKYEGANPTGSFKDRGMVMAVAKAKEAGATTIICASTGNTAASAAAYGARANLRVVVVMPKGKIAQGKLAQAAMYGAEMIEIEGNFDHALALVRELSESKEIALVNSVNPYRLEGQKTAAFEICQQLGKAPEILAIPVGNAGNISAYWKGFKEFDHASQTGLPQLHGFQAAGAAPIVHNKVIDFPETIASAIRIGNPASWEKAVIALNESNGVIDKVSDEEILAAYKELASKEGVFAEPGSCAAIAGVKKQVQSGKIKQNAQVVAILTGNGLKDPTTALDVSNVKPLAFELSKEALHTYLVQQEALV